MKPGPPHLAHPQSRKTLELAAASFTRIIAMWRDIAAGAQTTGRAERRARAERKIEECESELARVDVLLARLDEGLGPAPDERRRKRRK